MPLADLVPLPASWSTTRGSLRSLACYVIAPWRKAMTGHISLRPVTGGFGTPPLDDGGQLLVRGGALVLVPDGQMAISTLRAAAELVGVALSPDPGVGTDLPAYDPDAPLDVDAAASAALGEWYAFGQEVIDRVQAARGQEPAEVAQLWPEHFDLAVTLPAASSAVNVGASPGDGYCDEPYLYVGPHRMDGLDDAYWNAPFGACRPLSGLLAGADPVEVATAFVLDGLGRLDSA